MDKAQIPFRFKLIQNKDLGSDQDPLFWIINVYTRFEYEKNNLLIRVSFSDHFWFIAFVKIIFDIIFMQNRPTFYKILLVSKIKTALIK